MKKRYIIIIVTILFFAFAGILCYNMSVAQNKEITADEAEKLCFAVMGEKDEKTGFPFSFGVTGTIEKEGKEYYIIRATWLVNNSHMSYIGDFFVSSDGKEMYSGYVQEDEYIMTEKIWSK